MAQENKTCKICGEKGHSKFYCKKKPFKPIARVSKKRLENPEKYAKTKIVKPINKVGKRAKQWSATSREWKTLNPPDSMGYWYCFIGQAPVTDKSELPGYRLNLCHDESRARRPDLAFELSNIYPGCQKHNKDMGSKNLEEYLASNPDMRCGDF